MPIGSLTREYFYVLVVCHISYGVSVTTLEEVFLKVASDAADHKGNLGRLRRESSYVSETNKAYEDKNEHNGNAKASRPPPQSMPNVESRDHRTVGATIEVDVG